VTPCAKHPGPAQNAQARLDAMIEEARVARAEALALRSSRAKAPACAAAAAEEEERSDAAPAADAFAKMSVNVRRGGVRGGEGALGPRGPHDDLVPGATRAP